MIFEKKNLNRHNGCIVVLEDNPSDREFFCQTLAKANYKAIVLSEGNIIDTVKREKLQMILMSAVLSGRKSLDLCAKLKATIETKNIPILVVAEKGDKSNIIEYYSQNVESYLMKPVSKRELLNQVETLLSPQRR